MGKPRIEGAGGALDSYDPEALAVAALDWLAGMAVALRSVHDLLGDSGAGAAVGTALGKVRACFGGQRWGEQFELLGGNAGIALGALVERYSYGWCHGPAGDAQVFRLLHQVTDGPVWLLLADRCWHTVTQSGLPARLRPGFWDNSGRCCGTAGVLALACDRYVESGEDIGLAATLVADLTMRATDDAGNCRWGRRAMVELRAPGHSGRARASHRVGDGNAGIVRELLRYARIRAGRSPGYATSWPDQPAVVMPPTYA